MSHSSTQTVPTAEGTVEKLNSLLRGEISAVETYDQAIKKFADPSVRTMANTLTRIRDEHARSVVVLRERVLAHGGTPPDGAGVWGAFANTVTGAAKLFGPQTVLSALKQGEQHGVTQYEQLAENPEMSAECRYLIRNDLLPHCHDHVVTLEMMIAQIEQKTGG